MKTALFQLAAVLAFSLICVAQTPAPSSTPSTPSTTPSTTLPAKSLCAQHAGECAGQPKVIIEKLTPAELQRIARARAEVARAQQAEKSTRDEIIRAHGGYLLPDMGQGGMMMSGMRVSDGVEWRGDYIILTKEWLPEL